MELRKYALSGLVLLLSLPTWAADQNTDDEKVVIKGKRWQFNREIAMPELPDGVTIVSASREAASVAFRLAVPEIRRQFDLRDPLGG